MTTQATATEAVEAVAAIQAALALLPIDADSPWTNLDKMPYIHKTDDPKASPWNCAVVGRFDYLQTMQYMLACQPSNIRALLASLAAKQQEVSALREALEELMAWQAKNVKRWHNLAYDNAAKTLDQGAQT